MSRRRRARVARADAISDDDEEDRSMILPMQTDDDESNAAAAAAADDALSPAANVKKRSRRIAAAAVAVAAAAAGGSGGGGSKMKSRKKAKLSSASTATAVAAASSSSSSSSDRTSWSCTSCTLRNVGTVLACSMCGAERPPASSAAAGDGASSSWSCSKCTMSNTDDAIKCTCCGSEREEAGSQNNNNDDAADDDHDGDIDMVDMTKSSASPVARSRSPAARVNGSSSNYTTTTTRLEHNLVFLAGIEESFGRIDLAPRLLTRIAHFIRPQWNLLVSKFGGTSTAAAAGAGPRDEKKQQQQQQQQQQLLPLHTYHRLQKALVREGCEHVMRIAHTMATIFRTMEYERLEMIGSECTLCLRTGKEVPLIYSTNCYAAGEWVGRPKHYVCQPCASRYVMQLVTDRKCDHIMCVSPSCSKEVDIRFLKACLSQKEFAAYSDACFELSTNDSSKYQRCPKCDSLTEIFTPSSAAALALPKGGITLTDDSGKVLTPAAYRHYSQYRLRCHECSTNFCTSCRVQPYHLGKTCDEWKAYQGAQHCRYCTETLHAESTDRTMPNGLLVCKAEPCQQFKSRACRHKLECGHACYGVKDEANHPLCLDEACEQKDANIVGSDLCSICYVEELQVAPIVQLTSCNHIFHEHCVIEKIKKGKPGCRITFGYLECPSCKVRMNHPSSSIQALLKPAIQLYDEVAAKATARLTIEGMTKDEKLIAPTSRYYQKPTSYAMDSFAYYNCYKCKKFYFGGRRDCEQNAAAEVRPDNEFVCYDCADLKSVKCKVPAHSEYQVWKCRFCCTPAIWFCFGSTHFCDPCHNRYGEVTKNPKVKCKDPSCSIKVLHSNGKSADCEYNLGCGVCQEELHKLQEERKKEEKVNEMIEKEAAAASSSASSSRPSRVR